MRRVLLIVLAIVLLQCGISYSAYVRGATTTHRLNVSANDDDFSTITAGSGINSGDFGTIALDVVLSGTSPQWTITPGYYSNDGRTYVSGSSITLTESGKYTLETYGNRDIYIRCSSKSGTSPTISIYATPIDSKDYQ